MPKPNFLGTNTNKGLTAMLLLLVAGSVFSYALYGPYYSPDTVNYFDFSRSLFEENIWASIYSPVYPLLLHCLTLLPFPSLFHAAHLLILVQYGLGVYFLYQWVKIISTHYQFNRNRQASFLLLLLIVSHSWWSFRIVTWAHADAMFYCLLVVWGYFMSRYFLQESLKHLLILSFLSAAMIWVKLNALSLIPFYALLIILDKEWKKWLFPLCLTAASYLGYRYLFQYSLLNNISTDSDTSSTMFSLESLEIMTNNLAEFFKTSLGFLLSDVVTAFIPHTFAILGGISLLLGLLFIVFREIKKGFSLSSLFLLFSVLYLLCQLSFQQMAGFEEINYRTLFPYLLAGSWYVMIRIFRLGKTPSITVLLLAFLISSHTLAGHLHLWQRQEVNSLFEAERLAGSALIQKAQLLHQGTSKHTSFVSDRPTQLALLLNNPFVVHYDPEFDFIHGKRRPISEQQRQKNSAALMEKLLKGEAVAVIFGEDESLVHFAQENGVLVFKYAEGTLLLQPRAPVLH